jgi:RNase adaptor protein for sRNA GlmZ degradation
MSNITLMSFGFKYGLPNANYYFDVGFVKNPARENKWGFFSGANGDMITYVLDQPQVCEFLDKLLPLIEFLSTIDQNQVFAFGCSAGRHRSNIIVEEIHKRLLERGIDSNVKHRDLEC